MGQASNSSFVWECVPESYHFLSEDRQWHLSITLERQGQEGLCTETPAAPPPKHRVPGEHDLESESLGLAA